MNPYQRGSEWRQWDLHIHSPASFHWDGQKLSRTDHAANRVLIDSMIGALNAAEPAVFAIMDYWTFDGWLALQDRLKEPGAPVLTKTVFPGIELRLAAPTQCRLNAHVIFSDKIDRQTLLDFKSALKLELLNRPLSDAALIAYARAMAPDQLQKVGFKKTEVDADDEIALNAGSQTAEINCDSYKHAIATMPEKTAVGFMPFDTSDGLAEVKWHEHYAYFIGLFNQSPIFESRNDLLRDCFLNQKTDKNANFLESFQHGLSNIPRLVVSGSDAHRFAGTKGDNNKRGYGDFPSQKATWIKADPTFRGLQQAILEPAKRSFIGLLPPKLDVVEKNKTFFIDRVTVGKTAAAIAPGAWLHGTDIYLNPDLIEIIGNKGSGKSALADVIALLGNSRQREHFSFLKRDRFRGKSGEPAKSFAGTLHWLDGSKEQRSLNDDPPEDKVELVRYIPQGHFEELCNAHVSGRSSAFENELRSVIFSHASDEIRLGSLDFDQLVEQQESSLRDQLNDLRKDLHKVNQEICFIEEQLAPEVRSSLAELLAVKGHQIAEHEKIKPAAAVAPTGVLSTEQQAVAAELAQSVQAAQALDAEILTASAVTVAAAQKAKALQNVRERLRLLERAYRQFGEDAEKDLLLLGLKSEEIAALTINAKSLDDLAAEIPKDQKASEQRAADLSTQRSALLVSQTALKGKLDAPQLVYQQSLAAIQSWETKKKELIGTPDSPDSSEGLKTRIAQLDALPTNLNERRAARLAISGDIFDALEAQRAARAKLFAPVQSLIQSNSLIREDYKLQFQASLGASADAVSTTLFSIIKQNTGDFRGEDESFVAVRKLAEPLDFGKRDDALAFAQGLHDKISRAARSTSKGESISSIVRKDKVPYEVYDLVFGLSYLSPRYSLLFQEARIEQLSPGQRGALLLIFYLLVDKGRNPIILDQPEENLDNETVVSLLVPVLTEAKRNRQIIMVTHNPNLAVVCDAEQIIWSVFDRKGESKITYVAGAIESPDTNTSVVNVLEGTKPALDNRVHKYH